MFTCQAVLVCAALRHVRLFWSLRCLVAAVAQAGSRRRRAVILMFNALMMIEQIGYAVRGILR